MCMCVCTGLGAWEQRHVICCWPQTLPEGKALFLKHKLQWRGHEGMLTLGTLTGMSCLSKRRVPGNTSMRHSRRAMLASASVICTKPILDQAGTCRHGRHQHAWYWHDERCPCMPPSTYHQMLALTRSVAKSTLLHACLKAQYFQPCPSV